MTANAKELYDVVVLGADSAGAVVEAGPDYGTIMETPYALVFSYQNSLGDHDWKHAYQSTAEAPTMPFPRGRDTAAEAAPPPAPATR